MDIDIDIPQLLKHSSPGPISLRAYNSTQYITVCQENTRTDVLNNDPELS